MAVHVTRLRFSVNLTCGPLILTPTYFPENHPSVKTHRTLTEAFVSIQITFY